MTNRNALGDISLALAVTSILRELNVSAAAQYSIFPAEVAWKKWRWAWMATCGGGVLMVLSRIMQT
jgi:hypothetical protein